MRWKIKIKFLTLQILLFLFVYEANGQCVQSDFAFQTGDKLVYNVAYNLGFIWVDAGIVSFEVKSAFYKGKKVFHFFSEGKSLPAYDWFFKVRDVWQAYSDTSSIKPYVFKRNSSEGGYNVDNAYWFDYKKNKIYTSSENTNKKLEKDTFNLQPCLLDLVSSLYYVRNLDYTKYKYNDKIGLKFIVDNEIFDDLYARYLGVEIIELHDGRKFKCHKIRPYLVEGTMFTGGEDMTVWISTDGNNVPILVEAQVLVGSIMAELVEVKGLKYPLNPNVE